MRNGGNVDLPEDERGNVGKSRGSREAE